MSLVSVRTLLGAAALLGASFSSHATLIVNGDFEENFVRNNNWATFSSEAVGWQGSNIEIWNAYGGVIAASNNNFIELNSDRNSANEWSIFQTFATDIGREYNLSFFYRARSNNNEKFSVSVPGLSWTLTDHTTAGWVTFVNSFVATDSISELRFTSLTSGTYGNFIDKVVVTAVPGRDVSVTVPEPATLAVFGAGLLALVGGRRLRGNKVKAN